MPPSFLDLTVRDDSRDSEDFVEDVPSLFSVPVGRICGGKAGRDLSKTMGALEPPEFALVARALRDFLRRLAMRDS